MLSTLLASALVAGAAVPPPARAATPAPYLLTCSVDFTCSCRILLKTKPIGFAGTFSLEGSPSADRRTFTAKDLVCSAAAPSYARLLGRDGPSFDVFVPAAYTKGWSFGLLDPAAVATCEKTARAAARLAGRSPAGERAEAVRFVVVPHPTKGLSLRYGDDGTVAVPGSLYVHALAYSGQRWALDMKRERDVEPYLADLAAVLPLLTPPFRRSVAHVPTGAWRAAFPRFAEVAKRMAVVICGPDAKSFVAPATCADPVFAWEVGEATAGGQRLTGRLVEPCTVTLKGDPCLRLLTLERTVLLDRKTGAVLEDGASATIEEGTLSHPLFSVKKGAGRLSFRLAPHDPTATAGAAGQPLSLLGASTR